MNQPVCKFYKRNGYCHFLNKCWYSHSFEPTSKNITTSSLETTVGEATLDNGSEQLESLEKKDNRRSSSLKRYGKRYANIRNNFKFNSVRVPKKSTSTVHSVEGHQDHECSAEITSNSGEAERKPSINDAQSEETEYGKEQASVSQNSFSRRKMPHGNRRWNVYKGPRYFYGNVETRSKNQRVKKYADSRRRPVIHSEADQQNISQHQTDDAKICPEEDLKSTSNLHTLNRTNRSYGRLPEKTSELLPGDFSKLRDTEIEQLKKRFPSHKLLEGEKSENTYRIEYSPSDPDWPFQVASLTLQVIFPLDYPKVLFSAIALNEEHYLPELLVRHLNKTIQNWLKEREEINENNGVTELVFRPFLKWLDKNLENMFVSGLRLVKQEIDAQAAGIEFIPYENLCNSLKSDELSASLSENLYMTKLANSNTKDMSQDSLDDETVRNLEPENSFSANNPVPTSDVSHSNNKILEATESISISDNGSPDKLKDGIKNVTATGSKTEVKFKSVYLSENAATLTCEKVQLTIKCARCKTRHDFATTANKLNCAACSKCHAMLEIFFQPTMLHPHSSILGYLHLAQCKIVDLPLVSCEFSIGCLNCSNQYPLTGVHYDQQHVTWCHYCNGKMAILIQGVRFLEVHSRGIAEKLQGQTVKLDSKSVKNALIAVQPGKPLPENGTCRHYKKSYRWLRFPCCGKAYPCDLCHNEKEVDHEMKLACRMICGFCAKEQPYSKDKECISCGAYTTKKSGSHWEGGKGCRDKHKMSKGDKHKYSGANKTKAVKKVGTNVKKDDAQ